MKNRGVTACPCAKNALAMGRTLTGVKFRGCGRGWIGGEDEARVERDNRGGSGGDKDEIKAESMI